MMCGKGLNDTIWSQLLDGCDLLRDTETALKEAGEWETISIGPDSSEGYVMIGKRDCCCHICYYVSVVDQQFLRLEYLSTAMQERLWDYTS